MCARCAQILHESLLPQSKPDGFLVNSSSKTGVASVGECCKVVFTLIRKRERGFVRNPSMHDV